MTFEKYENMFDDFSMEESSEYLDDKKNNIVLVGLSGSGKSTIGRLLSQFIGFGCLDLDQWIENSKQSTVEKIISAEGEEKFRQIEAYSLKQIQNVKNHVLVLGGGICEKEGNWELIRNLGTTVWLDCSLALIAYRLSKYPEELKKRPLLSDGIVEGDFQKIYQVVFSRLKTLYDRRKTTYKKSDLVLSYGFSTPEEAAKRLKGLLGGRYSQKGLIGKSQWKRK